ncbi:hypothetical protein PIB30_076223 [Stylosanthes scabra]|uniref:Uncharacterized protein n=1 Tax=Stylosanthes scabra TaxID=79078 RepID=A0ABU6UPK3_9FABA|nr:hypothetical protein [Stylosanthes scabra]
MKRFAASTTRDFESGIVPTTVGIESKELEKEAMLELKPLPPHLKYAYLEALQEKHPFGNTFFRLYLDPRTSELSGTHGTLLPSSSAGHQLMRRLTTRNPTLLGTSPNMVFPLVYSLYTCPHGLNRVQSGRGCIYKGHKG